MALAAVLAILTGLFGHDPNLASPAPEAEWIKGTAWPEVRGSAIAPIEGGSAWAPIRGRRP